MARFVVGDDRQVITADTEQEAQQIYAERNASTAGQAMLSAGFNMLNTARNALGRDTFSDPRLGPPGPGQGAGRDFLADVTGFQGRPSNPSRGFRAIEGLTGAALGTLTQGPVGGLRGAGIDFASGVSSVAAELLADIAGAPRALQTALGFGAGIATPTAINRAAARIRNPATGDAVRNIAEAVEADPVQMRREMDALGPDAVAADVNEAFAQVGNVAAQQVGPTRAQRDMITARGRQAGDRIMQEVRRATGVDQTALQTADDIMTYRAAQGGELYERAYNDPSWQSTDRLAELATDPAIQREIGKLPARQARRELAGTGRGALVDQDGNPTLRGWQAVKENLDSRIRTQARAGATLGAGTTGELLDLKTALRRELAESSGDYAAASALYSDETQAMEMLDLGQQIMRPGTTSAQAQQLLKDLEPSDLQFVQLGAQQAMADQLERAGRPTAQGGGASSQINSLSKGAAFPKLQQVFGPNARSIMDAIEAEAKLQRTANALADGSQTYGRLVIEQQLKGKSGLEAIADVSQNPREALRTAIGELGNKSDALIQEIGQLVTSQNPDDQALLFRFMTEGGRAPAPALQNPIPRAPIGVLSSGANEEPAE